MPASDVLPISDMLLSNYFNHSGLNKYFTEIMRHKDDQNFNNLHTLQNDFFTREFNPFTIADIVFFYIVHNCKSDVVMFRLTTVLEYYLSDDKDFTQEKFNLGLLFAWFKAVEYLSSMVNIFPTLKLHFYQGIEKISAYDLEHSGCIIDHPTREKLSSLLGDTIKKIIKNFIDRKSEEVEALYATIQAIDKQINTKSNRAYSLIMKSIITNLVYALLREQGVKALVRMLAIWTRLPIQE